ncbi:BTB/POZ domain-containing protein 6-like [Acropora muricata]|uniref:BTB/POZ domain-containing protein 6-like n=1 Tax=Acropora muricata TaxID=159855 RepID=UPI0010FC9924
MSAAKNWQTTRPTIRERTKFLLNNDRFSDVKFVVRKSNSKGKGESKKVIPAHKFVLSIGSPVFEAMFYGELAETQASIELPDCEYESLLELLRYLYCDEVNLTGSNVMNVLYLAKKYMVPSLADKCSKYLRDHLGASNVFNILPMAQKYEEKELTDRCWEVIDNQSQTAMKSDGFTTIEHSLLEAVISRDTLTINEMDLFRAVNLWATNTCRNQGLEANGVEKRIILGEKVVKAIRFPVMQQQEFASVVPDTKILTPDEVINFFKFFNSAAAVPEGFSGMRRPGSRGMSGGRKNIGQWSKQTQPPGYNSVLRRDGGW